MFCARVTPLTKSLGKNKSKFKLIHFSENSERLKMYKSSQKCKTYTLIYFSNTLPGTKVLIHTHFHMHLNSIFLLC